MIPLEEQENHMADAPKANNYADPVSIANQRLIARREVITKGIVRFRELQKTHPSKDDKAKVVALMDAIDHVAAHNGRLDQFSDNEMPTIAAEWQKLLQNKLNGKEEAAVIAFIEKSDMAALATELKDTPPLPLPKHYNFRRLLDVMATKDFVEKGLWVRDMAAERKDMHDHAQLRIDNAGLKNPRLKWDRDFWAIVMHDYIPPTQDQMIQADKINRRFNEAATQTKFMDLHMDLQKPMPTPPEHMNGNGNGSELPKESAFTRILNAQNPTREEILERKKRLSTIKNGDNQQGSLQHGLKPFVAEAEGADPDHGLHQDFGAHSPLRIPRPMNRL